ncbi:hypothetical protein [Magnetospirillum aberrantis]|uniref:Uncharacterized protein n=1 Tax=Magnetospirillum aberrantis SpK TaxID=908842 RepID=A0A7C9QTX4_9PROT|nr:hypothetical protein [Magnetospirillum aberrantis]NFV80041.1 hypothetical protein [Magnetospirillum aberrantis SpK]
MAVIHPCRHCPHRPTCGKRAAAAIAFSESPLKVTLARLSCPDYAALHAPGDRVSAVIGGRVALAITGTITGTSIKKPGKWVVQVDPDCLEKTGFDDDEGYRDGTDHRPFVSVFPNKLTKLDEPRRAICEACGNALGAGGEHTYQKTGEIPCDGKNVFYLDDGSDF